MPVEATATPHPRPSGRPSEAEALHAQLVSGGGVLALCGTDCEVLGLLMPALAAAGRLDDLRVVHLAAPTKLARFGPWSRRPARDVFERDGRRSLDEIARNPADADGFEAAIWPIDAPSHPQGWAGGGAEPPANLTHLPEIGLAEILRPRAVTVLSCGGADRNAGFLFQRLSRLACGVDAGARPILIRPGAMAIEDARWRVAASPHGRRHAVLYPAELRMRGVPFPSPPRGCDVAGGVAWTVEGDRLVMAALTGVKEDTRVTLRVFEIDRDGWCTGLSFRIGSADLGLARLAVEAIRAKGMAAPLDSWGEALGKATPTRTPHDDLASLGGPVAALAQAHADVGPARGAARNRDGQAALILSRGCRARLDFLRSWGVFADMLLDPAFSGRVASGERTVPLVAERLGVAPAIARRLIGRDTMPFVGVHRNGTPDRRLLRDLLLVLGHDALPAVDDAAEWSAFFQCCVRLHNFGNRIRIERDREPMDVYADLMLRSDTKGWERRRERMDRWVKDGMAFPDCGEFVRGVREWATHLYDDEPDDERLLRALVGEAGLVRFMEASLAWHSETELQTAFDLDPSPWHVPFGLVGLGGGWTARVLSSNAELRAEGGKGVDADGVAGLDHCAGTFGTTCRKGDTLVVSIRRTVEGAERRDSTVDLAWDARGAWTLAGTPDRYTLRQHLGLRNAEPGPEARDRVERLKRMLAGGRVRIEPRPAAVRVVDPSGIAADRMRWAEMVLPRFQRLFPGTLRDLSEAAFRDRLRTLLGLPEIPRGAFMPRNEDFPC